MPCGNDYHHVDEEASACRCLSRARRGCERWEALERSSQTNADCKSLVDPLSSLGERHGFGDTLRRTTRMALVMASDGSSIFGQGVT